MKRAGFSIIVAGLCTLMAGSFAEAQSVKKKCKLHCGTPITKPYDLSASSVSGDQIRGPATVRADNLNVLRYDYKFNSVITFSAAPDLWAKLQSVANPAPAPAPEKPAAAGSRPVPMGALKVSKSVQSLLDQAEETITTATAATDAAQDLIDAAIGSGDPESIALPTHPQVWTLAKRRIARVTVWRTSCEERIRGKSGESRRASGCHPSSEKVDTTRYADQLHQRYDYSQFKLHGRNDCRMAGFHCHGHAETVRCILECGFGGSLFEVQRRVGRSFRFLGFGKEAAHGHGTNLEHEGENCFRRRSKSASIGSAKGTNSLE